MWVTEAQYLEHGVCARWLKREPPPLLKPPRVDAAVLANNGRWAHAQKATVESLQPTSVCHHSQLTWEEHAWYLRHRAPEQLERLSREDADRLQRLHTIVVAEQAAFRAQRAADTDVAALAKFDPRVAEKVLDGTLTDCSPCF